jgi:hypothetical protein
LDCVKVSLGGPLDSLGEHDFLTLLDTLWGVWGEVEGGEGWRHKELIVSKVV